MLHLLMLALCYLLPLMSEGCCLVYYQDRLDQDAGQGAGQDAAAWDGGNLTGFVTLENRVMDAG